jgi:hypothetical protein
MPTSSRDAAYASCISYGLSSHTTGHKGKQQTEKNPSLGVEEYAQFLHGVGFWD